MDIAGQAGFPVAMPVRLPLVDVARTFALAAMVVFHLTFDLELFGHLQPGTTAGGIWWWWSRATAGTFLFLVGVSLWLAHGQGIRWPAFWRRWVMVAVAALGVSLATRVAMGDAWVRFGILHCIAASSLLALPFLRLPVWVAGATAVAVVMIGRGLAFDAFNTAPMLWLGLATSRPYMVDYLPLLPWLAPVLLGVATARLAPWHRLAADTPVLRALGWPGRHSLAIYLVHQPLLIAAVWAWTRLAG
jgi:uncharacterized membrane protein